MSELFYGIILIAIAFFLHISIWKIRTPVHQKSLLIGMFSEVLLTGLVILFYSRQHIRFFGVKAPQELFEYVQIFIFFISVSLAYMVTYSALEADSPSLVMIMTIAKAGERGLEKKIFEEKMNDKILLLPRVNDLISEKLAYIENGRYKLTSKGLMFARLFNIYRKILKRPQMGG